MRKTFVIELNEEGEIKTPLEDKDMETMDEIFNRGKYLIHPNKGETALAFMYVFKDGEGVVFTEIYPSEYWGSWIEGGSHNTYDIKLDLAVSHAKYLAKKRGWTLLNVLSIIISNHMGIEKVTYLNSRSVSDLTIFSGTPLEGLFG